MKNIIVCVAVGLVAFIATSGQSYAEAKEEVQNVKSNSEIYNWNYSFEDASALFRAVQSSGFSKLAQGSSESILYVFLRDKGRLRIVAVPRKGGLFKSTSVSIMDNKGKELVPSSSEYSPILCSYVWGPSAQADPIPHKEMRAVELFAWTIQMDDTLKGIISVKFKGTNKFGSVATLNTKFAWD